MIASDLFTLNTIFEAPFSWAVLGSATAVAICATAGLILIYRVIRLRRMQTYEALSFKVHGQWREIVRGDASRESWRTDRVQRKIVQSIVIQEIAAAAPRDRPTLQDFLRTNGMLATCIEQAQNQTGSARRRSLLALGAMRVREAIVPLSEALDDWQLDTRIAAVRGLGQTGLTEAAEPIIEAFMVGGLKVPIDTISNALAHCYAEQPEAILPFLRRSLGDSRRVLARVASEMATVGMADEMSILAGDSRPEVRASAARGLAVAPLTLAIPALTNLARDEVWFVRLRATVALHDLRHPRAIPVLLEAVRDPNRLVRMRAAAALSQFEHETMDILQNVVDSRDRYALHAMISALELGGGLEKAMGELADPLRHDETAQRLLEAMREGAAGLWGNRPADPVVETVFP